MEDKFYFMYKTTNLKNNKFYIGVHETINMGDGYLGSGKKFKNSLFYHGKENFKREILEYFNNSKSMYNREAEIVNEELLKNPKCLNLVIGGIGGFTKSQRKVAAIAMNKTLWSNPEWVVRKKIEVGNSNKKLWTDGIFNSEMFSGKNNGFYGKLHSAETIEKMKKSHSKIHSGTNNSQYGTCWITNEIENKKIYKGDEIPNGFRLGRKIKIADMI